jgi:hypothetical protein
MIYPLYKRLTVFIRYSMLLKFSQMKEDELDAMFFGRSFQFISRAKS